MTWWAELVSGEDPVADLQMAEIRDIERGRGREREGERRRERRREIRREKGQALMSSPLRALSPFMRVPPS